MTRASLALAVIGAAASACGRIGYQALDDADGGAGLSLTYPTSDVAAVVGVTAIDLAPLVNRTADGFTIAPALPAGVALDFTSGVIAGVPTAVADDVDYTITATAGAETATFQLRLTALPGSAVDVTADHPDDNGGADAICFATPAGGCTLRAAVQTANRRTTRQLVLLAEGDYALGSALEPIANDVVIAGQTPQTTQVRASSPQPGYGMLRLATQHRLTLRRATFRDFGMTDGAVVYVTAGHLEVDQGHFDGNASAGSGGVFFVAGGARATIRASLFTDNESFGGCCSGWGGVIDGEESGTTITVERSTASGNRSAWGGFAHITTGTTLRLVNSTLYGNHSTIAGVLATPGGQYDVVNSTIAGNTNAAQNSAGLYLHSDPGHYQLANTLVAFNTDSSGAQHNCRRNDTAPTLTSRGGNLIGDGGGNCSQFLIGPGDRRSIDPGLAPGAPADHGGPTPTLLLTGDAAALGAGLPGECPSVDQRGYPRPDGPCDSGAIEMP